MHRASMWRFQYLLKLLALQGAVKEGLLMVEFPLSHLRQIHDPHMFEHL